MGIRLGLFSVLVAAAIFQTSGKAQASMSWGQYQHSVGSRGYWLFSPKIKPPSAGLIVVLHGCMLTGKQMAQGTAFNQIAEKKGLYVLYPVQPATANPWKCWNWFLAHNQQRGQGELAILAGMTQKIMDQFKISSKRVLVTGLSAGGGMAANLLACYSDLFSGAAINAGLEYLAATGAEEAARAMKSGASHDLKKTAQAAVECSPPRNQPVKLMAIHGTKDKVVHLTNSSRVIEQFLAVNDWLDDGNANGSFTASGRETSTVGGPNKYSTRSTTYYHQQIPYLKKIWVEGMGHSWSGGKPPTPYMDPKGLDVSQEIVDFFF